MDLILLQPGEPGLFDGLGLAPARGLIDALGPGPCIELVSMSQGMKQQVTTDVSAQSRASGRPIVTDITCVKYLDATSVRLYQYCLQARSLGVGPERPTLIHIARNSGDQPAPILTIALRDALVSEIQLQSHPDDMPTEQFKLNFTEILWTYTVQTTSEQAGKVSAGWSVARNRPIVAFTP